MSSHRFDKSEVAQMLNHDDRSRLILQVLEADWPTALAVLPVAMRAIDSGKTSKEGLDVLRASLESYRESYGTPDRNRLNALMSTLLDGLTRLILSDPPKAQSVQEIESILEEGLGEERYIAVRNGLENYLLPTDSSIGRVWASMNRS